MKIKTMATVSMLALMVPLCAHAATIYTTDPDDSVTDTDGTTTTTTTVDTPATTTTVEKTVTTTDDLGTPITETHWITPEQGAYVFNVIDPNLVKNGGLTNREIGRVLFRIYDGDGNGILDNNEWERRVAIRVSPVEKDTIISYHYDENGNVDSTKYTYTTFMQNSLLARYEGHPEGLSPHEFTGRDFLAADVNRDHAVDLKEWQGTYNASIDEANKRKAETN